MGFSKEQVIAYIDNLVDKQKAALEEEKEKYTQLQEENEKLVNERDNALELAREELQGEIDALNGEKDELMLQLEELKNENESLTASNEKLVKDKNELFESIKSIKSQLNDYIVKEKAEKEKLEELENENKILAIALQKAKNASNIDVSAYQAEIEQLRLSRQATLSSSQVQSIHPVTQLTSALWQLLTRAKKLHIQSTVPSSTTQVQQKQSLAKLSAPAALQHPAVWIHSLHVFSTLASAQ